MILGTEILVGSRRGIVVKGGDAWCYNVRTDSDGQTHSVNRFSDLTKSGLPVKVFKQ